MRDATVTLALYDALPADERAAVAEILAADPALAETFARWQALRAGLGAALDEAVPDRDLLVLYALDEEPAAELLTPAERARLDAARDGLEAALVRHPGLAAAVARIRADRDAFDAEWARAFDAPTAAPAERPQRAPAVRPLAAGRPPERARSAARWVWRVAALVAVGAFGGLLTFLAQRDAGMQTIRVAQARTLVFDDGSTVDLAAGSTIQMPEPGADVPARQARLVSGQALFRVVRDPAAPFTVTTAQAEVVVLGTTFGVTTTDVQTDVVLVSGAVTLAPRERPDVAVLLAPGQQSRVVALDAPTAPAPADLGAALGWTGGVFAREDAARTVARRIGERFGVEVSVAPALAGEPVSGEFSGADGAADALGKLALTLGARVERTPGGYRIVEAAR